MEYAKLTTFQLDALGEVCNIGAGNSATALSILLGTKIDMAVPSLNLIAFDDLFDNYKENEVVAVLVKVLDDISGSVLYVLKKAVALNIISTLTGVKEIEVNEMGISVVSEIGNIISSSFMNAIAEFVKVKATASVPAVAIDMLSAILVSTFVEAGQYQESILDIETLFIGDGDGDIEGHFYYIPAPGSLEKILESLGIR